MNIFQDIMQPEHEYSKPRIIYIHGGVGENGAGQGCKGKKALLLRYV